MTDRDTSSSEQLADSQQRFRELEALHRVSSYLHRLRDPADLARDVITLLKDVVHHDFAAVYLINGEYLKTFAVSDRGLGPDVVESDLSYLDSLNLKVGENITGWVAENGRSVLLNDIASDSRYLDSQADIQSELCVPMRSGSTVIGVVNLESTRKHAYQDSDQRVLEIVANQIAIAIENGQLLKRTAEMERLQLVADLTGGIVHDIGNMLVAMSFRFDLMRVRGSLSAAQQEELQAIRAVLDKTISMSRSLLQVGLPPESEAESIDINEHLRNTMVLMEALGSARMRVTFDICPGEAQVAASPGQIDQILINLAVNARQAIEASGSLIIRTRFVEEESAPREAPGWVRIELQDDGRGMSPETLASATQPLFTTREEGSGLGLATVARLVEELHGNITLQSDLSVGTMVSISLPLQLHKEKAGTTADSKQSAGSATTPA